MSHLEDGVCECYSIVSEPLFVSKYIVIVRGTISDLGGALYAELRGDVVVGLAIQGSGGVPLPVGIVRDSQVFHDSCPEMCPRIGVIAEIIAALQGA